MAQKRDAKKLVGLSLSCWSERSYLLPFLFYTYHFLCTPVFHIECVIVFSPRASGTERVTGRKKYCKPTRASRISGSIKHLALVCPSVRPSVCLSA